MSNAGKFLGKAIACVCLAIGVIFLLGFITMHLWNWLVPTLFSGPVITLWQALGLLVLSKILFWGFGGGRRPGTRRAYWRARCRERFADMTPEDRDRMKQKMEEKWCAWKERHNPQTQSGSND